MNEQRKQVRVKARLPVSFATYDLMGMKEGTLYNLSLDGSGVTSDMPVEAGNEMACYIHLPDNGTPMIIDLAKVRWITNQKFGLEFILIVRPRVKERLKGLVQSLAWLRDD